MARLSESERFWSYVVKGPASADCWIWTGAVADDGYGRFWTAGTSGKQLTVRPQRYAYQLATGLELPSTTMLLHRCDIPLCVHADVDPERSHVRPGTGNMGDRARRGRHENRHTTLGLRGLARAERARRSRQLRDAFRAHGWDEHALHAILNGYDPANPTLW